MRGLNNDDFDNDDEQVGFAFSLHLVACCRGDLRVSVSSSASPLASRFGSLSFSQLSFLAFWFYLLFFLPNLIILPT